MEKPVAVVSRNTTSKLIMALCVGVGVLLGGLSWYAYGTVSTKNAAATSKENGYQISWHFARFQVQQGMQEELKKLHGPVRFNGIVVTCPDSQAEFIWSLRPPSGNDLMMDAKKRPVIIAYAAGSGCKGRRRIATVREVPANQHWENATSIADDNEISWMFHCLVKDLDEAELVRDKEFRKSGI